MKRLFERYPVGLVMLLALSCLAPVLVLRDFSPANELRYLSIADEALASGHWLSFSNHGVPYADKPPLYFWLVMLCRLLLGKHSMPVLSLLSLLPAFGVVAVMDRWAFRKESPLTRAAAAMLLLTTGLFLGMAAYVRMDMLMVLFILLALYAYWEGKCALFGLFTLLALLSKGPVGLLLPPLAVVVYLVATGHWRDLGEAFNWPFWVILGGGSLLWLGGAYLEGGAEYLSDLTIHQTVGRAVRSFHHQAPFWFYLAVIWGAAAPWCLLTVPAVGVSLSRLGQEETRTRRERLFLSVVLSGFVLLSLFSSKLAIYLLPLLPFLPALFVLVEKRRGWRPWMRVCLGITALLFALLGAAAVAAYFVFDALPIPAEYGFARTPLLISAGLILLAGAVLALLGLKNGWQRPVLAIGASMLLTVAVLSPLTPRVNAVVGYRQLCEDILAQAPGREVCTLGLYRPENMDVYLGHEIRILDPAGVEADPDSIPEGALVVLAVKQDAAVSGRYSGILRDSGRTCSVSSEGLYQIWR